MESKVNTAEMLLINFTLFFFFKEVESEKKKRELRKLVWEAYGTEIL